MKKVLLVSALVLVIATSMVSGTLAVYTLTIPTVASGSVMAKNFVLTGEGKQGFEQDILIAPNDDPKEFIFSVSNNDAVTSTTAEVAMDLSISINLDNSSATKTAIAPLKVAVYKDNVEIIPTSGTINAAGIGTLKFSDELTNIAPGGETKIYTVKITWPGTDNDTAFAGHSHGTALTVSVTGTQK